MSKWNFKDWYNSNKEELARARRERYESDPEYKAKVLKRNQEYRKRLRGDRPRKPSPEHKPRHTQIIELTVDGDTKTHPVHHISYLAEMVNRSVPTLYGWERNGILPKTPFWTGSDTKAERLYTVKMVDIVVAALDKRNGRVSTKDKSFYNEVRDAWRVIGVVVQEQEHG